MKHYKAIAAMSLNRVIGREGRLPWHLSEDFKWFKTMTTGQILVMGRRTFESIGRPLPNRVTIVLSRRLEPIPGVRMAHALEEIDPNHESAQVYICGGADIYRQALPQCSELYLTWVKKVVEGDALFPSFETWFDLAEVIRDTPEFAIQRYVNKALVSLA
jgi:dihydrofolate reductase